MAGVEEARGELEEIVQFLREPKRFQRLGARVPKGVLLYGPPGTGKTLLAKAVAHESGATFYFQSASSFVEMYVGLGASRIRKLFETARKNQPAIVFIDELDAVGTTRSGNSQNREHDQTLNQLLVELDGFDESQQLIVMAASNRLEDLDPALLRPGRFDRQIHVSTPDLTGREAIFEVHTRGKPLSDDVQLHDIARQTSGLTGADLANICNEAAIAAGRRDADSIDQADFMFAVERVVAGLQQRKLITDKEKRVIAFHEAGHALVARLMSEDIQVTIVPRGRALGFDDGLPVGGRYVLSRRSSRLAQGHAGRPGRGADRVRADHNGAANAYRPGDLDRPLDGVRLGHGPHHPLPAGAADDYALSEETKRLRDAEQREITDTAYREALRLIELHRPYLDVLAARLLEKETIDRAEVDEILFGLEPESNASGLVGVELPHDRDLADDRLPEIVLRSEQPDGTMGSDPVVPPGPRC